MAKRKRVSLKDKSSESLGLASSKKGKGLDLLFGGPSETQETGVPGQPVSATGDVSNLSGLDVSGSVNTSAFNEGLVDELGLPVAMESPPDDLILASAPVEPTSGAGEEDAVDPSISPFAMPDPAGSQSGAVVGDANDLSGIVEITNSPNVKEENLSGSFDENDLSGLIEEETLSGTSGADDLAGLVESDPSGVNDLSGLIVDDTAAEDLSGLVQEGNDLSGMVEETPAAGAGPASVPGAAPQPLPGAPLPTTVPSSAPPPTTAAPINVPSTTPTSAFQPGPMPVTPPVAGAAPTFTDPTMPTPAAPVSNIPPPSTATGAPDLSPPRPAAPIELEAVDDNVAATLTAFGEGLTREDFKPKDELPDDKLVIIEDKPGELDAAAKEQVLRYIGPERRDALFERIQVMHDRVAIELSGNKADVSFALDTLREANEYVIQRPYEYDEALYRVALVETMLTRKKKLSRSSYWMGLPILFYGVVWTIVCLLGYAYPIDFDALGIEPDLIPIFQAVWLSGLAGGLGGTVEVFWRLYYRVSIKQDFDPQYLMYYIVKPILGFVLGLVMYFLVSVGTSLGGGGAIQSAQDNPTGLALTLLFGFIAGFRQESVFDMIYVIINKIAPDRKKGKGAKSVVPIDEVSKPAADATVSVSPSGEIAVTNP